MSRGAILFSQFVLFAGFEASRAKPLGARMMLRLSTLYTKSNELLPKGDRAFHDLQIPLSSTMDIKRGHNTPRGAF